MLRAQGTQSVTWPSTPSQASILSAQTTPAVSPTPPDTLDVNSDEESNKVQEISEESYLYLPDIHIFAEDISPETLEEEEGYHTDDLSEMEDEEFQESLKKQKAGEGEPAIEIAQETRDAFCTLMRDVSQKEWGYVGWIHIGMGRAGQIQVKKFGSCKQSEHPSAREHIDRTARATNSRSSKRFIDLALHDRAKKDV